MSGAHFRLPTCGGGATVAGGDLFDEAHRRSVEGRKAGDEEVELLGAANNGATFGGLRRSQRSHPVSELDEARWSSDPPPVAAVLIAPMARTRYKTLYQPLHP